MSDKPRLVVIAGPTGVGKTAVAVALARRLPIEVISADSRQVYRGMDAATGKPTREERRAVVHHPIDVADPDDRYQAARFTAGAAPLVPATHARRLAGRAAACVAAGLLDEVRALLARGYDPALASLSSIGYREFVRVARGTLSADEAQRLMQRDTVRYAKRQWTWFQREPGIEWLDVGAAGGIEGVARGIERRMREEGAVA